ncbi:MAG TPA: hypothetical protein VNA16_05675, partial [Abditibacteriaceae bacterium]|nr:hypothetical protein [Abditibacteriaceae bacterium]
VIVGPEDNRRFATPPTPAPPSPPPTPRPLVRVPGPQVIAPPATILPPFVRPGVGPTLASTAVLMPLPPVTIPRAPRVPMPPAGFELSKAGGQAGIARSTNKRVSGIIIGDGVRALLEIGSGDDKVTRVVQPGDEVDGITILKIERTTEGARTTMRLIIREGGEERYVDLRPAPQQATQGGDTGEATGAGAGPPGRGLPRGLGVPTPP